MFTGGTVASNHHVYLPGEPNHFRISPGLPEGLTLDPMTGAITGTVPLGAQKRSPLAAREREGRRQMKMALAGASPSLCVARHDCFVGH